MYGHSNRKTSVAKLPKELLLLALCHLSDSAFLFVYSFCYSQNNSGWWSELCTKYADTPGRCSTTRLCAQQTADHFFGSRKCNWPSTSYRQCYARVDATEPLFVHPSQHRILQTPLV